MKFAMTLNQLIVVSLVIFGALQFVPNERTNPPVQPFRLGSQPIEDLFRRACFDCHSNETIWPWYAKVAPLSWLVTRDVNNAREKLNFSTFNQLSLREQEAIKVQIWKKVKIGDMPPPFYMLGHPNGRVGTNDHSMLRNWCGVGGGY